ncbi:MAG: PspA-associated protein PspAB [Solirubrobacteraceae bacterium]
MGLRSIFTGRSQVKPPAARERLFALTTAYVTLETSYSITSAGAAGIAVQALATSDFTAMLKDTEAVVGGTAGDMKATVETRDDEYGFRWVVVRTPAVEDQVVAINGVSSSVESAGYGERLLCAVFAFKDEHGAAINFIYNYKRGSWYPFVPAGNQDRNTERELQLKAQIGDELPIEAELERWFPLWGAPVLAAG